MAQYLVSCPACRQEHTWYDGEQPITQCLRCGAAFEPRQILPGLPITYVYQPETADEAAEIVSNLFMRKLAKQQGQPPQHKLAYYVYVNDWLRSRGFESEPDDIIDAMDLPANVREQAEQAERNDGPALSA